MRVETPSTLMQMGDGSIPEAIRGFVKAVYPPSSGQGQYGPWQLQKIVIADQQGVSIEAMFSDRQVIPSQGFIGSELYAVNIVGQKGNHSIKRKNSKNGGKPQVFVYPGADVSFTPNSGGNGGNGGQPQYQQPPQQQFQQPPQQQNNGWNQQQNNTGGNGGYQQQHRPQDQTQGFHQPGGGQHGGNGNGQRYNGNGGQSQPQPQPQQQQTNIDPDEERLRAMRKFNVALAKQCAAFNRCLDAAVGVVKGVNARHADFFKALGAPFMPTSDGIKEMATALFIQTSRSADGLVASKYFPVEEFQITEAKIEGKREQQQGNQNTQQPQQQFQQQPQGAPFN